MHIYLSSSANSSNFLLWIVSFLAPAQGQSGLMANVTQIPRLWDWCPVQPENAVEAVFGIIGLIMPLPINWRDYAWARLSSWHEVEGGDWKNRQRTENVGWIGLLGRSSGLEDGRRGELCTAAVGKKNERTLNEGWRRWDWVMISGAAGEQQRLPKEDFSSSLPS